MQLQQHQQQIKTAFRHQAHLPRLVTSHPLALFSRMLHRMGRHLCYTRSASHLTQLKTLRLAGFMLQ
jgi:hypothetical protein